MTENLFQSIFRKNPLPCVVVCNEAGIDTVVCASDSFLTKFNLSDSTITRTSARAVLQSLCGNSPAKAGENVFSWLNHTPVKNYPQSFTIAINSSESAVDAKTFEVKTELIAADGANYFVLYFEDITYTTASEKQLAENALVIEKQERNLRLYETSTNTGFWELDVASGELFWSSQLYIISGIEPFSIKPTLELVLQQTHPDDHEQGLRDFNAAIENGKPYQSNMRIVRANGEVRHVVSYGTGLKDKSGKICKVFGLLQDLTDKVKLSNQLQQTVNDLEHKNNLIKMVVENIPVGVAVHDLDFFKNEFFNTSFGEIYGWDESVYKDVDVFMQHVYPDEDYRKKVSAMIQEGIESGDPEKLKWQNLQVVTSTGEKRLVNAAYIPVKEHGFSISTVIDITAFAQKSKELEEANLRYKYVTKATSDAIWDWDIENKKVYWGEGYETLFGYKTDGSEIDNGAFNTNIHPDDRQKTISSLREKLQGTENYWTHEYRYRRIDGTYAYVIDKGFIIRNNSGTAIRAVGAMQDISEIRKEQEHLKLLESVVNNSYDAILISEAYPIEDPGPRILFANYAFYKSTGYSPDEVIGKTPRILQGPLTDKATTDSIHNALEKWQYYEGTILNYRKNGEMFWNNLSITPIANNEGWYTHWISIQRDVTEKVIAAQRLERINRLYAFTNRLNHFILVAKNEQGIYYEACSAALEEAHFVMAIIGLFNGEKNIEIVESAGLPEEDRIYATMLFEQPDNPVYLLKTDGEPKVFNNIQYQPEPVGEKPFFERLEVRSCIKLPIFKAGRVAGVLNLYASEANFFYDEEIAILNRASSDISTTLEIIEKERQRTAAERKLTESSKQLNQAQEIAHIGNWMFSFKTQLIEWSDEACRIHGTDIKNNKITLDEFSNFLDKETFDFFVEKTKAALNNNGEFTIHHKVYRPDGTIRYVITYASHIYNANNLPKGLYGLCHDVTEFKLGELALLESKNQLADSLAFNESLINASPMGIASFSAITGECKLANKAYADAIGGTLEGTLKQNFRKIDSWQHTTLLNDAEETLRNGTIHNNEIYIKTTFNKEVWLDYAFLRFYDKETPHLLMLLHDITERKQAEKKLSETQEKYRQIVETTQEGIYLLDEQNKITYANAKFWQLLEYTEQEIIGLPLSQIMDPDGFKNFEPFLNNSNNGSAEKFDHYYLSKTGKRIHVSVAATPLRSDTTAYSGILASVTDLSEKEKLEALFEKASRLARIGSWEVDLVNNVVYFSDLTCEIHEVDSDFTPDLVSGIKFYKKGWHRERIKQVIKNAIENGSTWDEELIIVTAKGREKWVRVIGEVEMINGKAVKLFGSFQDIDVRKKAQLEVLTVLEEKNSILESIDDAFFAVDENWIVTYWNREAEKLMHLSKEEVVGKYLWKFFKDAVGGPFYKKYELAKETKLVVDFEEFGVITNKWLGVTVYPTNRGLSVYLKDISQRKRVEKQLSSERKLLRTLIDNLPDTIYYKGEQAKKLISNKVDYTLLGAKSEAEVLGKTDLELHPSNTGILGYQHDCEILNSGIPIIDYEERMITPEGKELWLSTTKLAVRNEQNEIVGLLGIGKDITQRKQTIIELNKLNEQLQQNIKQLQYTNNELEQFAYVASHDLQEPLRMITSFLAQIEKKYHSLLDDKGRQYIYFAVNGAKRMRQIILDLLEYSRTGRIDTRKEMVDLNEIAKEILQLHSKTIANQKATITITHLPTITAAITPMRQVFQNLIGNSLKYSRKNIPPEITISCNETDAEWQFKIEDNGIGISPEYFDKIFVIFQRLHGKEEYAGTGIGLAITKKIIENLEGKIWVTSEPGKGSCFFFTIPKTFGNEKH